MQPYYNYPSPLPPPFTNPASSKALTKLKSGKLIQAQQIQRQAGQSIIRISPYNASREKNNISSKGLAAFVNNPSSAANIALKRSESNLSGYQSSQSSILTQSDQLNLNLNAYPSISQEKTNVNFVKTDRAQGTIKPLSVFQATNIGSTSGDPSRLRSSSVSNFSFNNESDRKISALQSRISQYIQQNLRAGMQINEKQLRIKELQVILQSIQTKNAQLGDKIKQFQRQKNENNDDQIQKQNRIKNLEAANLELNDIRTSLLEKVNRKQQKILQLETSIQKIVSNKNQQITYLNEALSELSHKLDQIDADHSSQLKELNKIISVQQGIIEQNKIYLGSMNLRMQSNERSISQRQQEIKGFISAIKDLKSKQQELEAENKKLWGDLSSKAYELQRIQQAYQVDQNQRASWKIEKEKLINDFNNAKKIGQQQVEFLQSKVEEAALEKERFLQEIELTKAIVLKRNMIFERQVIYDLKQQNDRLWAKLMQKSQLSANLLQKDPEYWTKFYSTQRKSSFFNEQYIRQRKNFEKAQYEQTQNEINLQQRYRKFVQILQQQQKVANEKIIEINGKQSQHTKQDIEYYKNKCINLQMMVEQHLKINLSLKEQLEKLNGGNLNTPSAAQISILKNQLHQQIVLNQNLQRSLDLLKEQYELKLKAAQNRVNEIQNGNINRKNTTVIVESNANEQLKYLLEQSQSQIRRLANENRNLNDKLSQSRIQQSSPTKQNKQQIDVLRKQLQRVLSDFTKLSETYQESCQSYEQQLLVRKREFDMLHRDYQRLSNQYGQGRTKYDQLVRDIYRLQKQLNVYKSGPISRDNRNVNYYISLIQAKLLEMEAFVKQIYEHEQSSKLNIASNAILTTQTLELIKNIERAIDNCLTHCSDVWDKAKR